MEDPRDTSRKNGFERNFQRKLPMRPKTFHYLEDITKKNKTPEERVYEFSNEIIPPNNCGLDQTQKMYFSKTVSKPFMYDGQLTNSANSLIAEKNIPKSQSSRRFLPEDFISNIVDQIDEEPNDYEDSNDFFYPNQYESYFRESPLREHRFTSLDFDKTSNTSGSTDFWFETTSEYDVDKNVFESFETDGSDYDGYFSKSHKFFNKSTETFLNNSLTNLKNNNLPFADIENKNLFTKNQNYNIYDKADNPFDIFDDTNKSFYCYYGDNDANNNGKENNLKRTKLSISSLKRPLGITMPKPEIKQLNNNRQYFFSNRLFDDNLSTSSYNNKNLFYNFWFSKSKTYNNKNYRITSLARPLCFSSNQ